MVVGTNLISVDNHRIEKFPAARKFGVNAQYFLAHPEEAQQLSKEDLLELSPWQLSKLWQNVRLELQADAELSLRLPCFEHYNRPEDTVHFDGPPPPKYKCWECKLNRSYP